MLSLFTVPLLTSGLSITNESFTVSNLTILFQWNGPQGSGPQLVVDNYIVSITPMPLFPPINITTLSNSTQNLYVSLLYNRMYTASLTATNCAGDSETYPSIIEYGKLQDYVAGQLVAPPLSSPHNWTSQLKQSS